VKVKVQIKLKDKGKGKQMPFTPIQALIVLVIWDSWILWRGT